MSYSRDVQRYDTLFLKSPRVSKKTSVEIQWGNEAQHNHEQQCDETKISHNLGIFSFSKITKPELPLYQFFMLFS